MFNNKLWFIRLDSCGVAHFEDFYVDWIQNHTSIFVRFAYAFISSLSLSSPQCFLIEKYFAVGQI